MLYQLSYPGIHLPYLKRINIGMRRLERVFEIRQRLHELARILARRIGNFGPRTQVPYETREEPLGRSHGLKREVRDRVPDADEGVTHFISRECGQIDMRHDKLGTLDNRIERRTLRSKETYALPRLVVRKRDESGKERDREQYCGKVRHGEGLSRGKTRETAH